MHSIVKLVTLGSSPHQLTILREDVFFEYAVTTEEIDPYDKYLSPHQWPLPNLVPIVAIKVGEAEVAGLLSQLDGPIGSFQLSGYNNTSLHSLGPFPPPANKRTS